MIPITEETLIFDELGEHGRLIKRILHVKVPCPCCNQSIGMHKINKADLEFYKRFL